MTEREDDTAAEIAGESRVVEDDDKAMLPEHLSRLVDARAGGGWSVDDAHSSRDALFAGCRRFLSLSLFSVKVTCSSLIKLGNPLLEPGNHLPSRYELSVGARALATVDALGSGELLLGSRLIFNADLAVANLRRADDDGKGDGVAVNDIELDLDVLGLGLVHVLGLSGSGRGRDVSRVRR